MSYDDVFETGHFASAYKSFQVSIEERSWDESNHTVYSYRQAVDYCWHCSFRSEVLARLLAFPTFYKNSITIKLLDIDVIKQQI